MISLTYQDLTVTAHRRARSLDALATVDVRPDTRRTVVLKTDHLEALSLDNSPARRRPPTASIERSWRGWTAAYVDRPLLLMSPQRAKPAALAQFLLEAGSHLDVLVTAPTSTREAHRAVLESLADHVLEPNEFSAALSACQVPPTDGPPPAGLADSVGTLAACLEAWAPLLADGAAATWDGLVQAACRGTATPSTLIHGLGLASLQGDVRLHLDPAWTLRMGGPWLSALGNPDAWARIVRQASPERAVSMSLGFLCWSPKDIIDLSICELAELDVPQAMVPAVDALLYCRRECDTAPDLARAICDPSRRSAITEQTVRRWTRLLGEELALPMPRTRGTTTNSNATRRLRRLDIGWPDAI